MASERNKAYQDQNLLTLPVIEEEPSKLSSSPSKKEVSQLNSSLVIQDKSIEPGDTPKSFSVSITVTKPDNPGDIGHHFSQSDIARLVQLVPEASSRQTIHQLLVARPIIIIEDETNAIQNTQVKKHLQG